MHKKLFLLLLSLALINLKSNADVPLTLSDCEEMFLKRNLNLLAAQYDISAAKALIVQAKIRDRPMLQLEANAYNPNRNKVFDVGPQGQTAAAISQLFLLGGKRKQDIAAAKADQLLAELQFQQLLVDLRLKLRADFFELLFAMQNKQVLNDQAAHVDSLTQAYRVQADRKNVALKDVVRLQSLSLNLQNESADLDRDINELQSELQLLTGANEAIVPIANEAETQQMLQRIVHFSRSELLETAKQKNAGYLYAAAAAEREQIEVRRQKAAGVPDINLGLAYDKRGGAFNNQLNLTAGIPIPLWSKNKGNLEAARQNAARAQTDLSFAQEQLRTQIDAAYNEFLQRRARYKEMPEAQAAQADEVYRGVLMNFKNRNISLMEFTDFVESYRQSTAALSKMKAQLIISAEKLNALVNDEIFK